MERHRRQQCSSIIWSKGVTRAAGVFSLCFILTAAASLITQILEVHLHLFTGLLD